MIITDQQVKAELEEIFNLASKEDFDSFTIYITSPEDFDVELPEGTDPFKYFETASADDEPKYSSNIESEDSNSKSHTDVNNRVNRVIYEILDTTEQVTLEQAQILSVLASLRI